MLLAPLMSMVAMAGKEKWMIPILMALFAAGGTIYGMAEESLAFYAILIPVMIRAGYDSVTGVAIIMLGAAIGTLGSTINPFATVIASNAAGVPFTDGIGLRLVILLVGWLICVLYVMRYAEKVRRDPSASLVADMKEANEQHFLSADPCSFWLELCGHDLRCFNGRLVDGKDGHGFHGGRNHRRYHWQDE